jgi:hypothetical protein
LCPIAIPTSNNEISIDIYFGLPKRNIQELENAGEEGYVSKG